jgi:hypothetical protein
LVNIEVKVKLEIGRTRFYAGGRLDLANVPTQFLLGSSNPIPNLGSQGALMRK